MAFQNLTENPQETTVIVTALGLLFSQGLTAADAGVMGRLFIYFGEVLATISVLMVAQAAEENTQSVDVVPESKLTMVDKADMTQTTADNILAKISELQQQSQSLQDQIWALQKNQKR